MAVTRRSVLATALGGAGLLVSPSIRPQARAVRFSANPFALGVASGYPEPGAVTLWTRIAPAPLEPGGGMKPEIVPVDWEFSSDDRFRQVVRSGRTWATPEWAHSVHVEVTGLSPGREYWYRFTCGDARSPVGRTLTSPARGANTERQSIAVASCQFYERYHWAAYRDIAERAPDLVLHVGDYIYEQRGRQASPANGFVRSHDLHEAFTLDDYRQRYALYKLDPLLQAAHAASPWLVTWDDHEVVNDYAGAISNEDDNPELFLARRAAAYRAYYEHLPLPRRLVPFGPHQRLHTRQAYGSLVDVFMLDGRQYRSDQACGGRLVTNCDAVFDANRTMLGETQERWLEESLANSRARWTLCAQGVVFAHHAMKSDEGVGYWAEDWNGYMAARQRFMDGLAASGTNNAVILSGDVHCFQVNDVHARPGDFESPIAATEFVTTSIGSSGPDQERVDSWVAENPNMRYGRGDLRGYVHLTVTPESIQADLVAVDDPRRMDSTTYNAATYYVEDGRPGAVG